MQATTYSLIYPMAALVFYICVFGFFQFIGRFKAAKSGKVHPKYFKTYLADQTPPEYLVRMSNHYNNFFQTPMLFMITCLVIMQLKMVAGCFVWLAWVFVFLRLLHAYIHLTSNHVLKRAATFFASFFVIVFMWALIVIFALSDDVMAQRFAQGN